MDDVPRGQESYKNENWRHRQGSSNHFGDRGNRHFRDDRIGSTMNNFPRSGNVFQNEHWRHRQGPSNYFGQRANRHFGQDRLDDVMDDKSQNRDISQNENWRHRQGLSNHFSQRNNRFFVEGRTEGRQNRSSSVSSQRSNKRTYNSNYENRNQNRAHFSNNFSQSLDHLNDLSDSLSYNSTPIGFKALESLLEKDSETIIIELSNSKKQGLKQLLKVGLKENFMILYVRVLKKIVDASFESLQCKVLHTYVTNEFVGQLTKYIVYLPMHNEEDKRKNTFFWENTDEFWHNIIAICRFINETTPSFAQQVLPDILKSLVVCFPCFENQHQCHIADDIKETITRLNETVQELVKSYEESEEKIMKERNKKKFDEEPPDDFRQISVYPSTLELITDVEGFLRENVVDGPYRDVNHYLDVQFRLLREDFVGPLRAGIASFRSGSVKRIENINVYKKIKFLNPETINEQYCVRLRFDFSNKKKNFKYENSKRFMFGSLLCFTSDDFRSIIFGKVAERNIENLQIGELIVGFDQNVRLHYNVDYLMIECGIFFEPYYHVLNVLQNMSVENFPMEKYIIDVDPSIKPPDYLLGHKYTIPLTISNNFNDSQKIAFEAALNQEFCIIQGPPGTGKTYVGLKIAKILLKNYSLWYKRTPMLVICYTNHALDQFLEGITKYTRRILRVGGQSKNEELREFNLKNQIKFKRSQAFYEQRGEVQLLLSQIKRFTANIKEIELYNSIRDFRVFDGIIPNYHSSWFSRANKSEIINWLLDDNQDYSNINCTEATNVAEITDTINNLYINNNQDDNADSDESNDDEEINGHENVQLDDIFDIIKVVNVQRSYPIVSLTSLQNQIVELEKKLMDFNAAETPTMDELILTEKAKKDLFTVQRQYNYLNMKLVEGKQQKVLKKYPPALIDLNNPESISPNDRWKLYFYWLDLYKEKLLDKLKILNKKYRTAYKIYQEMRDIENTNIMKSVLVIGMTTTGAARLHSSLQTLKNPIVIVEEAAEVLEAHIVSSLTQDCKHLILIGDHQQLKPSTASYKIEKFYNLGISLFERMVLNKIQLYTLNIQHRMRPEISCLITPNIYPVLKDHSSVMERPLIKGLDKCVYFIDHTHKEEQCDSTSKKNLHEVNFLIHFARHLILNGYNPENITILAAYQGQMFEMQKEKKKYKHILGDMRIAVLDNYQGEECDIILLSLVRSNNEGKIGFLSIENRVCVALSRARNGFYIMGNMTQLCNASELWRNVRSTLEQQNSIGPELTLRCQVHTDNLTYVKNGEDFLQIPEGGCSQKCQAELVCGHQCTSFCHILDLDHCNYRCMEPCKKKLCETNPSHLCEKMCYQECGPCTYKVLRTLTCGHNINLECHINIDTYNCIALVLTVLPCGHEAEKPCHLDAETYRCPQPCEIKVEPCGHACDLLCHVRRDPDHLEYKCKRPCAKYRVGCMEEKNRHFCRKSCYEECEPCLEKVRKRRTVCPHLYDIECSSNVDDIICQKPCTKVLPCGHKCKSKCNEPCGKCEVLVQKINPICKHPIKVKCCEEPSRKLCLKKCSLTLPCGHFCTQNCNQPCTPSCKEIVDCSLKASCGHTVTKIPCWVANSSNYREDPRQLLKYCSNPCFAILKCTHICLGTCGECYQGRIHKPCNEKCGFPLLCNHSCDLLCRELCRPCTRRCEYKCIHSSCGKRCGEICTPCEKTCTRRCQHQKCHRLCGEICDVLPCEERCEKKIKCGHPCIGFCGDPCPPKCLICDKEELTTIFFGMEDKEGARFVMLNDCGHIFESEGMNRWMNQNSNQISIKVCPSCKASIRSTHRYSDSIKKSLAEIANVKKLFEASSEKVATKRLDVMIGSLAVKSKFTLFALREECPKLKEAINMLIKCTQFQERGKREAINKHKLNTLTAKLQVIQHIFKIFSNNNVVKSASIIYLHQIDLLTDILLRDGDSISNQEILDIQCELNRLARLVDFDKFLKLPTFNTKLETSRQIKTTVSQIENLLFGNGKFTDKNEEIVKELLENLSKLTISGINISDSEKRKISKVKGFKQGCWYKCRKGHPYGITDRREVMIESDCEECGVTIRGDQNILDSDN